MAEKTISVNLTTEQLLDLSSLLSTVSGVLQYKAVKNSEIDAEWEKWHTISKIISTAAGFESFCEPDRLAHFKIA
jgi:hypothetical protein